MYYDIFKYVCDDIVSFECSIQRYWEEYVIISKYYCK